MYNGLQIPLYALLTPAFIWQYSNDHKYWRGWILIFWSVVLIDSASEQNETCSKLLIQFRVCIRYFCPRVAPSGLSGKYVSISGEWFPLSKPKSRNHFHFTRRRDKGSLLIKFMYNKSIVVSVTIRYLFLDKFAEGFTLFNGKLLTR